MRYDFEESYGQMFFILNGMKQLLLMDGLMRVSFFRQLFEMMKSSGGGSDDFEFCLRSLLDLYGRELWSEFLFEDVFMILQIMVIFDEINMLWGLLLI